MPPVGSNPAARTSYTNRVFGLDLLRAAAILSVVCAHGFVVLYPHFGKILGVFGHGGFYGVELFFVLSGFLIGQILIRQGLALGQAGNVAAFYIRRWFRTLPLFFLFLAVNVWIEFQFREHHVGLSEVLSHGFFLRNLTGFHLSFFPESWSLAIEEWFYLLFPAALWFGLKISRRFDGVFLCAAFAFFAFSTLARMLSANDPDAIWSEAQRMVVIYRFDALMFGMFAAWISLRFPERWRKHPRYAALAGGALLLAMYLTLWKIERGQLAFGDDSYFARTFRFTLVSLGFALLLPWASGLILTKENFGSIAIRRIALWSYGIYLVHLPVFWIVTRWAFREWKTSAAQALASFSLQIGGAIVLSGLLYRFFEAPCTRLREKAAPAVAGIFPRS
ncbi:MAG: acyltransferase [Verrucomicrobiota bacterium]|nr:acyltransferase [Verrucomicrobiota bacterium]